MKRQNCLVIGAAAVVCSLWTVGARAESIVPDNLRIDLDSKASRPAAKTAEDGGNKKDKRNPKKEWIAACNALGKALSAGRGPYGFGSFVSYSCHRDGKIVDGKERPGKWQLKVVDGLKGVSFTLSRTDGVGGSEISSVALEPSKFTMKFFKDDEFADHIAYALLNRMPMGMVLTKAQVKGSPPSFKVRYWAPGKAKKFKYSVPDAPENLVVFRLTWDEGTKMWRSQVVGSAKRTKVTKAKYNKKKKKMEGGEVQYDTTPAVNDALSSGPLWAMNADGPGAGQDELKDGVKEAQKLLDDAANGNYFDDFLKTGKKGLITHLLDSAASGYVGFRYGREVLQGEGELGKLMNKTQIIGVLVEIRGGPVAGLRYYYDKLPETKVSVNGDTGPVEAKIAFARHVIGYSFDFDTKFLPVIDKFTIDPKMGIWTFNATMPTQFNTDLTVHRMDNFNLGTTASLSLELGLETISTWYTLRGWYSIATGFSIIKSGAKVTSNRFGVDAYFTAGPTFDLFDIPFKTALMGFYLYENVSITTGKKQDVQEGQNAITGLAYGAGYAGGGVALSW